MTAISLAPLLAAIGTRAGAQYGEEETADRSMRVIADHLRAITFLMADGVLPSNEGRGYVLRRILRRAARHGRLLGITEPFLHGLTATVVEQMGGAYHELRGAAGTVAEATRGEEERFIATLDQGLPILTDMLSKVRAAGQQTLSGADIFKLYDTYGFPMDLIAEAGREQDIRLDETGFEAAIEDQRTRARRTGGFETETARPVLRELTGRVGTTAFVGYDQLNAEGVVQVLLKGDQLVKEAREGDEIEVVLDVTPFYAEGGGQAGDQGLLTGTDGSVEIRETTRPVPTLIVHRGVVRSGSVREGERLQLSVNRRTRQDAARNHTATHLVHAALRDLLGPHVKQYGSLVAPNRLRFDFAHFRPLASRDIDDIEGIVNEQVRYDQTVRTDVMGVQEAVADGALAFFGDKYGDQVRVVRIDTFSKELCGGTHCGRTGEIGLFRIVSEAGVAAGVRRIECLTGSGASDSVKRLEADVRELSDLLKVAPSEVVSRARKLTEQLKDKERELAEVKLKMASASSGDAQTREINGVQVHAQRTDGLDVNGMRALADQLRDKLRSGVVALGAANDGKVSLLIVVTKDLVGRLKAGELIKEMATDVGGTGGGRPEMAQAGGKNPEGLGAALEKVFALVQKALER